MTRRDPAGVRLLTHNDQNWSARVPLILEAANLLRARSCSYVIEFRTAEGDVLAISIPRSETAVIRHFQERLRCGLFVPDSAI
jgi:hypothetical protein